MTMHRRAEMEGRIHSFDEKCDRAIEDLKKLKKQAHSFVFQLNCEPAELKERFLTLMKKLDEYTYLITDFNLALGQIEEIGTSDYTPVQDNTVQSVPAAFNFNTNLIDALSEPAPSTSCACSNLCPPEKPKRVKVPKEHQTLISFSSSSSSSDTLSVSNKKSEMVTKEVQCSLTEEINAVSLEEPASPQSPDTCDLPAQTMLEVDHEYSGIITAISGSYFWIITDDSEELQSLMEDITNYYENNPTRLSVQQARAATCCAYYDHSSKFYYRALYIKEDEESPENVSLFLVDTGELRVAPLATLAPLARQFCDRPPFARYCHLAGVDQLSYHNKQLVRNYETFMNDYVNTPCTFLVDDNSSESIGVYVKLPSGETLNNILVRRGLAVQNKGSPSESTSQALPGFAPEQSPIRGPPEIADEIDIEDCPEYEDPVEAVTGYHNRDEADICKHYKGGPDKTCFKGSRCTKKHIMHHPDGWTLDRVPVIGKIKSLPLPAPGTWLKVTVTHVCHFDRFYVHIIGEKQREEIPAFGVVLPPTTLLALERDMNSEGAKPLYKPLQMVPAEGEIVAVLYLNNCWYRGRVLTLNRAEQSVEVLYIDYGTVLWVKENTICALDPRYAALPIQAIRCVLAGVFMKSEISQDLVRAKKALTNMIQDQTLNCNVIARDYDEITVELLDNDDYSVSQQLAAQGLVELREYSVCDDTNVTQKLVVP